jgi:hypothetical protein
MFVNGFPRTEAGERFVNIIKKKYMKRVQDMQIAEKEEIQYFSYDAISKLYHLTLLSWAVELGITKKEELKKVVKKLLEEKL